MPTDSYGQKNRIDLNGVSTLTLRGLRDRLTEIIAEAERNPHFADRPDLPVVIRVRRPGRAKDRYIPLNAASSGMVSANFNMKDGTNQYVKFSEIETYEESIMTVGAKRA